MNQSPNNIEQAKADMEQSKLFNPKVIRSGVIVFLFISILSLIGIFFFTDGENTWDVWLNIKWSYLSFGLVFLFGDLYFGGLRNHIFMRHIQPGISQMVSIKANLANIFMGSITPSQTGGGPAQWYVFHKNGISLEDNISVTLYNFISTIVFFPLSGLMALFVLRDQLPGKFIMDLTRVGFSTFSTILILLMVGLFAPQVIGRGISLLGNLVKPMHKGLSRRMARWSEKTTQKLQDYRKRCIQLIKEHPELMLYSFLITIIIYFNKYALAYFILLAFDIQQDFWVVVAIQAVLSLIIYFAPSPGASGIAEVSISALMASIISEDYLGSFTLLYRAFILYIPAMIGAFVVLKYIGTKKEMKE